MTPEDKSDLLGASIALGPLTAALLLCIAFVGCAALKSAALEPCPPHKLASIDARFAVEAIRACKAEGADADTCKALPGIRAKYAAEREAWVACERKEP
jgi:hypothetical protein